MSRRIFIACLSIVTFIIAFFLLRPLLTPGFPETDDGTWMIIRLTAFYQALADGQFPVRFLGRLNNHFGYPVANFLYPGYLYIGSILRLIGFSFVDAVKLIMAGSVLVGAGATFFWLRSFFPVVGSLIGTMVYLTSPYIAYDLYVRGSVGELLAIAMVQVTIMAIEKNIRFLIPLSFALLLISHNTLAVFFVALIVFYVFYRRKMHLMLPLFIGGLISVFFWIPVLFEKSLVFFDSITVSDPTAYTGITLRLLSENFPFLILSLFVLFKSRYIRHFAMYLLAILLGLVLLVTPLSKGIWSTQIFHHFIQFPFRFFAFFPFFAAFFTAYAMTFRSKIIRGVSVSLALISTLVFFILRMNAVTVKEMSGNMYLTNEATTTVMNEYLPRWVSEIPPVRSNSRVEVLSGDASVTIHTISTRHILFSVNARSKSILRINTIYYPGWIAAVDGYKIRILYNNPRGLMEIPIETGTHDVEVEFKEDPLRLIADALSVSGLILYVVYCVRLVLTNKGKQNTRRKKR